MALAANTTLNLQLVTIPLPVSVSSKTPISERSSFYYSDQKYTRETECKTGYIDRMSRKAFCLAFPAVYPTVFINVQDEVVLTEVVIVSAFCFHEPHPEFPTTSAAGTGTLFSY